MGRRASTCSLDILDHSSQVNRGNPLFNDLWGRGVIPLESRFLTLRTSLFTPNSNDNLLEKSLDLVKEWRENAMVQLAYYQQKLKQRYDSGVKLRPLNPGDLVLRKVVGISKNPAWGKLRPNWEEPYRITSVASVGAYFLEDLDEKVMPQPWNVNNLRRYYY